MPSQLKQLQQTVQNAGINKHQQPNKRKFEGTSTTPSDKEKKKKVSSDIHSKFNKFDTQVQRLKHNVGGRKVIGSLGAPAKAKQAGIDSRKEALLPALQNRNRTGQFKDRRFGEQDPTLDEEDRMLERYQAEKANTGKRTRNNADYNLEDNDELTHYGQSLALNDDFANAGLADDDDPAESTRFDAFGGFGDGEEEEPIDYSHPDAPPRRKTKAEVMEELITKSKAHKMERQQQREDDDALREQVDADLDDIKGLLFDGTAENDKEKERKNRERNAPYKGDKSGNEDYDQFVRQLAFDRRAKPTDRLKSDAEVAFEAREELEKNEKARLLRMRGEDDSQVTNPTGGFAAKRQRAREEEEEAENESHDDENPSDDEQVENAESYGIGKGLGGDDSEQSDDEDHEDVNEEGENYQDGDSDDSEDSIAESNEGELGDMPQKNDAPVENLVSSKKKSSKTPSNTSSNLPYTFECPSNHDEFMDIVESNNIQPSQIPIMIERIRTLYHPELGEENKAKLALFNGVLLDHLLYTASTSVDMKIMETISRHIEQLTKLLPIPSADIFKQKLELLERNFNKGVSAGATNDKSKTWPGIPELSILRVVGVVWSTSDYSHPVGSAAQLLIGQYLSQARIRSLSDIIKGLVLCGISLQYEHYSKRFIPEVVNFLISSVLILGGVGREMNVPGQHPVPDVGRLRGVAMNNPVVTPSDTNLRDMLTQSESNSQSDQQQAKVDVMDRILTISREAAQMWSALDGFIEAFDPLVGSLRMVEKRGMLGSVKNKTENTLQQLGNQVKFAKQSRRPLRMQQHKQIAINSLVPKFEENYNADRRYDPDHDRAATSKLKAEVKAERKGAIRELRKDAKFIAGHKQKERREELDKYEDKMRKKVDQLGDERAEEKSEQKAKAKFKKMAGK
ncbi:putative nucleolar complex protein 14 [Wallemia ichthyophaga EXF-994]|uniref:Nucleolar complex protein 14 n=2 Tax=Wallemia ichthyophaga TaxID=245174 RepID=A0A4T0J355_WALIC|nr:putative nucleolar complex protein 14 [Wallemia ichthyophaga EXF-994]EOQ99631.1 putative nucleolar complex protein 14 [Wallemia ichthyophaga EXF-994]TIB35692.1 hypothetical protein E3P84_01314 [Wallemia ichthyophaga]TIB42597.1 hypothetical protein E3P83_01117 [Wallemia ichthyophaga]TIB43251.1 hypothetical protein E3P86_00045 [Wallemia ichthyophaga]